MNYTRRPTAKFKDVLTSGIILRLQEGSTFRQGLKLLA